MRWKTAVTLHCLDSSYLWRRARLSIPSPTKEQSTNTMILQLVCGVSGGTFRLAIAIAG